MLLFCVLIVGHAACMVAIVNRIHAWPLPFAVLHRLRQLHDLSVVILPAIFAWLAGFQGQRLFSGGSWFDLPPTLLVYLAVCSAMAARLAGRRHLPSHRRR